MFGANDAALPGELQHVPLDRFSANLHRLVDWLHARFGPSLVLVLSSPPPLNDAQFAVHCANQNRPRANRTNAVTREYRDAVARVAEEKKVLFCDLYQRMDAAEENFVDGLHLTAEGNRKLFEAVLATLPSHVRDEMKPSFRHWKDLFDEKN